MNKKERNATQTELPYDNGEEKRKRGREKQESICIHRCRGSVDNRRRLCCIN